MEHTARLLDTPDCEACGAPVIEPDLATLAPRRGGHCSPSCATWARKHPGQWRGRPPCSACGEPLHHGFAVEGRWCTLRCRDRDLNPPVEWLPPPPARWALRARCRDADPDVFFADKGGNTREAKRICAGCPVRQECLDYALAVESGRHRSGVWGGLSPSERRAMRTAPPVARNAPVRAVA